MSKNDYKGKIEEPILPLFIMRGACSNSAPWQRQKSERRQKCWQQHNPNPQPYKTSVDESSQGQNKGLYFLLDRKKAPQHFC